MRPRTVNIRFLIFVFLFFLTFSVLGLRLVDLQLVHGQTYLKQADENRFYTQTLAARRGSLLDRYGEPLVWNIQKYYRALTPSALFTQREPITREEALRLLSSSASESAHVVSDTERLYRYPSSLAHVLGYVGEVTAEDLERQDDVRLNQHIGKAGLELIHERELRGIDGKVIFEVDALGQRLRQIGKEDAQPGQDIQTTLDPYLNEVASRTLSGIRGTIIITDAQTGQVIALSSQPSFDPNILSQSFADPEQEKLRKQKVQDFFQDPQKVFFNRAIAGAYPPGSIFKLVTALAGLEEKKIDASTQVVDEGVLKVGEFQYGNWYFRQFGRAEGSIGLVRALARSNDIYFYKVAEWTGPNQLATMAKVFGLGEKTGIGLPAEARGLVPTTDWKEQARGERWFLGNTYHYGIGQGDVLTSPVQIAQLTQALANNGKLCKLSLVSQSENECRELGIKTENLRLVDEGMIEACSSTGTAFPFFPYNATRLSSSGDTEESLRNGAAACKTGTAEFGGADEQGYRKTHGWFTLIVQPQLTKEGGESAPAQEATPSAVLDDKLNELASLPLAVPSLSEGELYQKWREKVSQRGFPERITITVLVESDDINKFREGSKDGGPIAKKLVDWMMGN